MSANTPLDGQEYLGKDELPPDREAQYDPVVATETLSPIEATTPKSALEPTSNLGQIVVIAVVLGVGLLFLIMLFFVFTGHR